MSLRSRACLACYGLGAIFTALSARLIYLGVTQHDYYAQKADESYSATVSIPARRGTIQDATRTYLARNVPYRTVILDGFVITETRHPSKHPEKVADLLARSLGMERKGILEKINAQKRYVVLKKKVAEEDAVAIERAAEKEKLKGIIFEHGFDRVYPEGATIGHVLGFCGFGEPDSQNPRGAFRGVEGVERSMDAWLAGQDGWRHYEKDARGNELVNYGREERSPRHGGNVQLTVNLTLQQIVESELESACKRLRPLRATVIMMKPDTGEILALSNRPTYDPNEAGKVKPEVRFNYAIAGSLEPGSTFKMVTCAGALNYRLVTPKSMIDCSNGKWSYGGLVLHDHHPYGMMSVSQIIEHSSNIGAAKLAVQIGQERFYNWVRNFGFGQQTGVALPGEVRGILHSREDWEPASITRVAMGHEVTATPMQIITATCAIANGGKLMMPQLVHEIRSDSGEVLASFQPQVVRQVMTPDTAAKVGEAMVAVTGKKGTAKLARIPGFNTAGKTGTAQKLVEDPKTGRKYYSHDFHVTSFVGFVPAEKPALCLLVIVDQARVPSNEDVGGLVAAPVFRAIAERSLAHLGIEPDPALLQQGQAATPAIAKAGRN